MSKYIAEDEGFGRCIWRDTSQPIGAPDEDGTRMYESAETYEVEEYMNTLEAALAESERKCAEYADTMRGFFWLMDKGALVRNIDGDAGHDYMGRVMRLALWLKEAALASKEVPLPPTPEADDD